MTNILNKLTTFKLNNTQKGVMFALLSAFFYGLFGLFTRELFLVNIPTETILFWRFLSASVILACCIPQKVLNISEYIKKQYFRLFLISMICHTGSCFFFFTAMKNIGSGLAITIFFCFPLFVMIYSRVFLKEKISTQSIFAMLIMIAGITMLHDNSGNEQNGDNNFGIIMALCSSLCFASYIFFSKKFCNNVKDFNGAAIVCLGSCVGITIINIFAHNSFTVPVDNIKILASLASLGLFSSVLPIYFVLKALKYISATKVACLTMLEPITAVIIGFTFLNEHATQYTFIGIILILISSVIMSLQKNPVQ